MAVDRAIVDKDVVVIGRVHQLVAGAHHAGAHGQRLEDEEFGYRQRNQFVCPGHQVARRVHRQAAAADRIGQVFGRLGIGGNRIAAHDFAAPQNGANAGEQQALAEWLGDVIVGAHSQAQCLVGLVVLAGQEDHRQVALLAQAAQQFQAIHARHLDVAHRQVGGIVEQRFERGIAVVVEPGDKALGLQCDRYRGQDIAIIIDQRDRAARLALPCRGRARAFGLGGRGIVHRRCGDPARVGLLGCGLPGWLARLGRAGAAGKKPPRTLDLVVWGQATARQQLKIVQLAAQKSWGVPV